MGILRHPGQLPAPGGYIQFRQGYSIDSNMSGIRFYKAQEQMGDGALASAGWSHQGHLLTGRNAGGEIVKGRTLAFIEAVTDVGKADIKTQGRWRRGLSSGRPPAWQGSWQGQRRFQDFENTLGRFHTDIPA